MRRKGRGAGPEPPGGNAKYGDDEGGTLHVHSVVLKLSTFYCQDISFDEEGSSFLILFRRVLTDGDHNPVTGPLVGISSVSDCQTCRRGWTMSENT